MEYKEKNKYNPKVNLSSRSKINQDILKEESINTPKNYYLRSVNTYKNPKGNRKEINNIINNDYDKFELLDKIKKAQNSLRKINLMNIFVLLFLYIYEVVFIGIILLIFSLK